MYIRRVNHIQIFALSTSWELLRYARPSMRPPVWQSTRTPLSLRMSKSATRWDTNTNTMTPLLLRMTRNVTRWNTNTKTTLMLRISKIKNKINIMMLIFLLSSNTGVQEVLRVRQVWLWHRKGGKSNHQILIHSNQNTWCQVVLVLLFSPSYFIDNLKRQTQVCSNKPVKECDTRPKTVFKKLPDTTCERIPFEACAPDNCKYLST